MKLKTLIRLALPLGASPAAQALFLFNPVLPAMAWAAPASKPLDEIGNPSQVVRFSPASKTFSAADRGAGRLFLTDGQLDGAADGAVEGTVSYPVIGEGKSLPVPRGKDAGCTTLEVYPASATGSN